MVTFFGYEVQPGTWSLSTTRKDAIARMVFPTHQKKMQSFLGAANFFHKAFKEAFLIQNISDVTEWLMRDD